MSNMSYTSAYAELVNNRISSQNITFISYINICFFFYKSNHYTEGNQEMARQTNDWTNEKREGRKGTEAKNGRPSHLQVIPISKFFV